MPFEAGKRAGMEYDSLLAVAFGEGEALAMGVSCKPDFDRVRGTPTTGIRLESTFQLAM